MDFGVDVAESNEGSNSDGDGKDKDDKDGWPDGGRVVALCALTIPLKVVWLALGAESPRVALAAGERVARSNAGVARVGDLHGTVGTGDHGADDRDGDRGRGVELLEGA